jgi:hypothetical protein
MRVKSAVKKAFKDAETKKASATKNKSLSSENQKKSKSNSNGPAIDNTVTMVEEDNKIIALRSRIVELEKKYKEALKQINNLGKQNNAILNLKSASQTYKISPKLPSHSSEATAVLVASDWHVEEKVDSRAVNGVNEYNVDIAKQRGELFFKNGLRLVEIMSKDVTINTIILALLGDFITNDIHEESMETNILPPNEAIILAKKIIASGIDFLLKNSKCELVMVCHSGNHGRTTKKIHVSNEHAHSLEFLMYHALQDRYLNEPRVKFIIPESYHSYIPVYSYVIRFHHGHEVKYGGGVGGIYIPVNKAIAQWNKIRLAHLDVFGHFHQFRDGSSFVSNGSMIGYNAYALSIKADFEKPRQALFLIDKKRGKTLTAPILFE